ncbi:copper ion binding protein [Gimesia sp.]|uniref:heavy-metal-associated domain-containing protein n=1 Tax=Gimesia sp. TaxID=2024833 RepID=UPI0025BEA140|nr:copper ion binding protein [Gimesia sp.]
MTEKNSSDSGKNVAKQWLMIGVVLVAIGAGTYFVVFGQRGSNTAPPADAAQAIPNTATPDGLTDVILPVEGMSCGACAARVKGTLKGIDGVADIEVSLAERHVRVRYADEKVNPERLAEAINELGYKASVPAARKTGAGAPQVETVASADAGPLQVKTVTIPVDGMACEYCAQSVKERLAGIDGVKDVGIRLKEKEARVQYVEGKVTPQRLVEEIAAQGFKAGTPTVKEE